MTGHQNISGTVRCFIGIEFRVSPAVRDVMQSLPEVAAEHPFELRLVTEKNLHVTLKFLGEVEQPKLAAIELILRQIAARHDPFQLSVKGLGQFTNAIWIGVESSVSLSALAEELDLACAALGFPPETRSFQPHVTVARYRECSDETRTVAAELPGQKSKPLIDRLVRQLSDQLNKKYGGEDWGKQPVSTIRLYRSETKPEGADYTPIIEAELRKC